MLRLTQAPTSPYCHPVADLLAEAGMTASVQRQYLGVQLDTCRQTQCLPRSGWIMTEHAPAHALAAGASGSAPAPLELARMREIDRRAGLSSAGNVAR